MHDGCDLSVYLEEDLHVVDEWTEFFILEPAQFCNDGKQLSLSCQDKRL